MARTAPVPNIPAIPGMNPGIFVLGGGGDGGGSGEGGGKGKGKGQGADGKNGGKDANGGGKGAGACGPGSSSGCSAGHGSSSVSKGDPVDVATGRVYTVPATDLTLPGPLTLDFTRRYTSGARYLDVGLGFGWAFSLGWSITVRRRTIDVWNGNGIAVTFDQLAPGAEKIGQEGFLLRREADGFVVDAGDELIRTFREPQEDGHVYRLTEVRDANGNTISLRYEQGKLVEIVDAVGRHVRVVTSAEGRIEELLVKNAEHQGRLLRFARYSYDDAGHLVSAVDADGNETTYTYDEEHLLRSLRYPTGLVIQFCYDDRGRCVETWGEREEGPDPSLDPELPATLADGETKARGVFHVKLTFDDDFTEVVDADSVQRFFVNPFGKLDKSVGGAGGVYTRTYDEHGHEISLTDPLGATTQWERDERGRVLAIVNRRGYRTEIRRDAEGRMIELVDQAGHTTRYVRDARGNLRTVMLPLGVTSCFEYDARGLVTAAIAPNGARTEHTYDAHGNCVEIRYPNGSTHRYAYDYLGRLVSQTTPLGATATYSYTNSGKLQAMRDYDGGVTRHTYDGLGDLVEAVAPNGALYKLTWGGYRALCRYDKPDGSSVRFWFDREGRLRRVRNEVGGEHVFERDAGGRLIGERLPDGRHLRFERDLAGNVVKMDDGAGRITEMIYDTAGEIVERRFDDGTVETTTLDERGDVVEITDGVSTVKYLRDALRHVVRETQIVDGVEHAIDVKYDSLLRRGEVTSSAGFSERITRDVMGHVRSRLYDGRWEVRETPNVEGLPLVRELGGGAGIESVYDTAGKLVGRRAFARSTPAVKDALEPALVGGPVPVADAFAQRYQYAIGGELSGVLDAQAGATEYRYGPGGHLDAVIRGGRAVAEFSYDPAGNVTEAGLGKRPRTYAPDNQLRSFGDVDYRYDAAGCLIEKVRRGDPESAWRYTWNAKGLLESARGPGGAAVSYRYDPLGRRVEKQVGRAGIDGAIEIEDRTRYVWDGDVLVHALHEGPKGEPLGQCTFAFEEGRFFPIAQRDGDAATGSWRAYVNDTAGTPAALLDDSGRDVQRIEHEVWGRAIGDAPTPLRFQGQYADPETGLHYNRYRYYDPETGRYISPDPLGIAGGFNAYQYVKNPVREVDPLGLITAEEAAKAKADELNQLPNSQKPNCVTAVVDKSTGKVYYGTPGEPNLNMNEASPFIKDNAANANLPPGGIANHGKPPGNCGEPKAVDAALKDGAKPENLEQHTVFVGGKKHGQAKERCKNCGITTGGITTTSDPP
ncbi:MAG: RHS repeat-associated core domain-containing protein [Polyangiaceae bacterium]